MTVTFKAAMQLAREVRARADLLPSSKLVFDALIDRLNVDSADKRNGLCNPKDATLAADCGMSVSTIKRETRRLVDAGLLLKTRTSRAPIYTFLGLTDSSQESDEDRSRVNDQIDRHRATRQVIGEPSDSSMMTDLYEQPIEQPKEQPITFEAFWSVFPRRVGKKAAEKAFRRTIERGEATADTMIEGAIRYQTECRALAREDRYIKHPTTWINAGCWTDDPAKRSPEEPEKGWKRLDNGRYLIRGDTPEADAWRLHGRITLQGDYAYLPKAEWSDVPGRWPKQYAA